MMSQLEANLQACAASGGSRMSYDGKCATDFYSLYTVCYYD
jgi:hypothetical protein